MEVTKKRLPCSGPLLLKKRGKKRRKGEPEGNRKGKKEKRRREATPRQGKKKLLILRGELLLVSLNDSFHPHGGGEDLKKRTKSVNRREEGGIV